MEGFGGTWFGVMNFTVRKKRSSASRRPCSDSLKLLPTYTFSPQSAHSLGSGCNGEEYNFQETTVGSDGLQSENRLKKLKLKLGGVTHTIHTKYASESSPCFDIPRPQEKLFLQDSNFGKDHSSRGKLHGESMYEMYKHEPIRKSKRVPKRRVMDIGFDEDDDHEDDEIRYLGRLNASKVSSKGRQMDNEIYIDTKHYSLSNSSKDGIAKLRLEKLDEDRDYMEDEEPISDDEPGYKSRKQGFVEGRNRSGASLIEFPNGLPPAPRKKQKVKLSEVEQQLKRTEAAQRRRIQSEKTAREAEAEAIRKILGQDSGRKKKEVKMKKQRDELAQAANSSILGSNTVRCIIGPTGTVVVFSDDVGLPNIFNSVPCSYPPPREKCAGPNCANAYKYRDSKSNLPLCSLHCYQAIHGQIDPLITC